MQHAHKSHCTDRSWKGRMDCAHCGIRHFMMFSEVPESGFTQLLHPVNNYIYPTGAVIYEEGVKGQSVFSIRSGLIKLLFRTADGSQRIVRLLGKGATVGLELLDEDNAYHHSAVVIQDVDLCNIPIDTLKDLQIHHPSLCDRIRHQLQQQVDYADHWINALNTGVARTRITQLLLLLMDIGADRNGHIRLLSRVEIAGIIGVTTETASRLIAEFKRRGMLVRVASNTYRCDTEQILAESAVKTHT